LSSKGQVVIPAWVRRKLHLSPGDQLVIELGPEGERTVILRGPTQKYVESLLERGYDWLEKSGDDLVERLHEARRGERRREGRS